MKQKLNWIKKDGEEYFLMYCEVCGKKIKCVGRTRKYCVDCRQEIKKKYYKNYKRPKTKEKVEKPFVWKL